MMELSRKPLTVFVEGNIASGKSTLLDYFSRFEETHVLKEDLNKWTNFYGHNLLDLKLKNPESFQFPFQSYATLTRLRQHLENTTKPIKMMERSLISARRCFVEAQKNLNLLHEGNYFVLQEWYDYIDQYHEIKCDLIIYIQTDPGVAFQRIQSRARVEESRISLEYVKEIDSLHEKVFVHPQTVASLPAPVHIVNGNLPEEEMLLEYKKCEAQIFR